MDTRLLIVSASPRPYGNSRIVARFASKIARDIENVHTYEVDLFDYRIEPCIGCVSDGVRMCKLPCVLGDDMDKLYELVAESDGIIFVSPIYWYNVPGPLKNFIDRLTVFENAIFIEGRSRMEGKVAGFIVVGNDTGGIAVIQNLMVTMNSMGAAIPPWALAYHESDDNPIENENFILDVANVIRGVVLMVKALKGLEKPKYWYRVDKEYKEKVMDAAEHAYREVIDNLTYEQSNR
ncbi:MAG: flavodoxin family protein [Ignisphaera sp.]|nr:flavodoxin family protein [Ignisphaera sp.]MCX8167940.1 flavodoxin family protein [Ignisphaera sp.]MDW8085537.1 flavodoxin family protein [Ignisphaera sp.]